MLFAALRYLAFVALALAGPGIALQRVFRLPVEPAVVVPLGAVFTAGSYWLSLVVGIPWLFPVATLAVDATLLLPRGPFVLAPGPALRALVLPCGALIVLLAVTQYPWNRIGPDGGFRLDPIAPYDDAVFHVGVARELAIGYPPQVPGLSGFPLGYHLGTGLVRAAALRWAGIEPYDAISRLEVTLWALVLALGLQAVAYQIGAPPGAVALAPWTLLLTDFSFVFAGNPGAFYWCDLLKGNLLFSLAYVNPVVPGLGLTLACVIALARGERGEGRGWLLLAAVLAAALPHFKAFLGAHLLLGLGLAAVFGRGRPLGPLVTVALPCLLSTLALALGPGRETVLVSLSPFDLARATQETLGLEVWPLALWVVLWLTTSLGLRLLGLVPAARALVSGSRAAGTLAAMALAAWPLGLLLRIAVRDAFAGQRVVNDALYIVEQGGPLLWVFTAVGLVSLARSRLLTAGLLCLAIPSTLQFAFTKSQARADVVPAPMVRATLALRAAGRPGEVVLQRPGGRYPPLPVLLSGLRVPYERYTPFRTQFASRQALDARHEMVYRFFRTTDGAEALEIARRLGVSFLALYGTDRVRFDPGGLLEPIHEEPGARVYRIRFP